MVRGFKLKKNLLKEITSRKATIAVVGLGYVGLPTAASFASLGFRVIGIDINQKIITQINEGSVKTKEKGLDQLIKSAHEKGLFSGSLLSQESLRKADVVIVCVQTPVDNNGNGNLSFLKKACEDISQILKKGMLIVIQSTVPPKTMKLMVVPVLEKSGLKCGLDFWLVYCPERMAPGSGINDLATNTRLIGAYDSKSGLVGTELYRCINKGKLVVTDMSSAEISKLAENTFRYINIAFANELALICKCLNVDVFEVIKLANTHPRVMIHQPGCGAGGPCLSKDTHLLLDAINSSDYNADFLLAATRLNSNMPRYVVEIAAKALGTIGKKVADSKIAVFGTAYKADVNDSRDSPAGGVVLELKRRQAKIVTYDPNCDESFGEPKAKDLTEAVSGVDCLILTTNHKEFYELDLPKIKLMMGKNPIIVDTKRIINPAIARSCGFEYVTISGVLDDKKNSFD